MVVVVNIVPCAPLQFDANGDGEITLVELQQAMQRLLGDKLTSQEISEVVQEADINGDGTVDFEGDAVWGQTPPSPQGDFFFQVGHSFSFSSTSSSWSPKISLDKRPRAQLFSIGPTTLVISFHPSGSQSPTDYSPGFFLQLEPVLELQTHGSKCLPIQSIWVSNRHNQH